MRDLALPAIAIALGMVAVICDLDTMDRVRALKDRVAVAELNATREHELLHDATVSVLVLRQRLDDADICRAGR